MTVLLTGCAGFIGSHLCESLLSDGHRVIGVDNFDPFYPRKQKEANLQVSVQSENFEFHELDFYSDDLNDLPEFDLVVHMGAKAGVRPSIADPQAYINTNYSGTNNILELMKRRGVKKLVFASSSSVYGNCPNIPFDESDPLEEQISPYAFTKRACEMMNYTYHHLENMDVVNLRFFTVYGPRQRPDLAIRKFTDRIHKGTAIQMFGDGSSARDYTFVADTVAGIRSAINWITDNDGVFETINLGNNTPVKLKELIEAIENTLGKKAIVEELPMQPGDVDITFASIDKARDLLGYDPQTKLKDGLKAFADWYLNLEE